MTKRGAMQRGGEQSDIYQPDLDRVRTVIHGMPVRAPGRTGGTVINRLLSPSIRRGANLANLNLIESELNGVHGVAAQARPCDVLVRGCGWLKSDLKLPDEVRHLSDRNGRRSIRRDPGTAVVPRKRQFSARNPGQQDWRRTGLPSAVLDACRGEGCHIRHFSGQARRYAGYSGKARPPISL